jgi:hypothetical protein
MTDRNGSGSPEPDDKIEPESFARTGENRRFFTQLRGKTADSDRSERGD